MGNCYSAKIGRKEQNIQDFFEMQKLNPMQQLFVGPKTNHVRVSFATQNPLYSDSNDLASQYYDALEAELENEEKMKEEIRKNAEKNKILKETRDYLRKVMEENRRNNANPIYPAVQIVDSEEVEEKPLFPN